MTSLLGQQQADREMGQTDKQAKQTDKQKPEYCFTLSTTDVARIITNVVTLVAQCLLFFIVISYIFSTKTKAFD